MKKTTPLLSLLVVLCASCTSNTFEPLSDPEDWNGDYMYGAEGTSTCPTDTIASARTRMHVDGPFTIAQYEQTVAYSFTSADEPDRLQHRYNKVSDFVRDNLGNEDEIYAVSFYTDPNSARYWGFEGYVVARNDCVVHVSRMGYTN